MALSAACFAALMGMVRHLSADMDVFVISFWRNCAAVLILLPWFLRVGRRGLRSRRQGLLLTRAIFMVLSSITIFFGVTLMPIAEATAISFATPLFAVVLAILVLKELVGPRRWIAILVGFAGVLIVLRPGTEAFQLPALLVLFSSLAFGCVMVTGKLLAATESPELIVANLAVLSVPLSFLPALAFWQWPAGTEWLWLVALGVAANGNMYGIARALQIGDASLSMAFDFVRLPMTALVGFMFFAESPDVWTWAGGAVIVASAFYITRREMQTRS
jgi:drug/metabolite transporter (DMT)-like permease